MNLNALVLCSDEKIVRVLRRALVDLDIGMEVCGDPDTALRKLTRRRFEAMIVDCDGEGASAVLKSARSAPCNRRAIAVAVVDSATRLKSLFEIGAHFVLYKPVSSEKARSSFRAARALMKSERRRNTRVPVQIPVVMRSPGAGGNMRVTTIDLSEAGMAINIDERPRYSGRWQIAFTLPGSKTPLELPAEFAWEGATAQAGLRFANLTPEAAIQLRDWLKKNSPEPEPDDPPIHCQLTDLSLGGCYLEMTSPFPVTSRVTLSMRAAGVEVKAQGVVRIMHPDRGMGVEFTQATPEHRSAVEKFLDVLSENRTLLPELLVEPEGLETDSVVTREGGVDADDPILRLFRGEPLTADAFHAALRQQRTTPPDVNGAAAGTRA